MPFRLSQDPNSQHLGTTVWDASIVLAKYLEQHAGKGEWSRAKLKTKRCIELGAGSGGLAGMVTLTDVQAVLPLLQHNVNVNVSPAALKASGSHLAGQVATVNVCELDWLCSDQWADLRAQPFDYVLAADCIYEEGLVAHLLTVVNAVAAPRATVLVANELRSEHVHATFLEAFAKDWQIKRVALNKMHPQYRHPLIHVYALKRRGRGALTARDAAPSEDGDGDAVHQMLAQEAGSAPHGGGPEEEGPEGKGPEEEAAEEPSDAAQQLQQLKQPGFGDAWETRRLGAALAACMAGVAMPATASSEDR